VGGFAAHPTKTQQSNAQCMDSLYLRN